MDEKIVEYYFNEIKIGLKRNFQVTITESMLNDFAKLSGDYNPLHNHLCDTLQGLSDILYTKVPQPFRRTQLWTVAWSSLWAYASNRVADVYVCTI